MARLEQILLVALSTPMGDPHSASCIWGAPVVFWGPPGVGKSERIEQVSEMLALPLETLYLATHQPEDISGIPMPNDKGGATRICDLPQVQSLTDAGKGVLFLDELSCARPAVQGAGLGVVYTRRFAGKRMPGRIRVVGAANPAGEAAGGWELDPPMANRFMHVEVTPPTPDESADYELNGPAPLGILINEAEDKVQSRWKEVRARYTMMYASWLRHHKDEAKVYCMPAEGSKERGRAWPSPRSWKMAMNAAATAECLDMPELALDMVVASVGLGLAAEWAEWAAKADLPSPKDALEKCWRVNKKRLDIAHTVLQACVNYALKQADKDQQKKYIILAWKLLAPVVFEDQLLDIASVQGKKLMDAGFTTKSKDPDVVAACKDIILHLGKTNAANFVQKTANP